MATVYRLETKDHTGVYAIPGAFNGCNDDDDRPIFTGDTGPRRPTPYGDPGINRSQKKKEYCAFTDINQLFRWFCPKDILNILGLNHSLDGYIYLVRVDNVCITAVGERQCLFTPPRDYNGDIREGEYHVVHKSEVQKLARIFIQSRDVLSRVPAL
jgi:hypothetical protein